MHATRAALLFLLFCGIFVDVTVGDRKVFLNLLFVVIQ